MAPHPQRGPSRRGRPGRLLGVTTAVLIAGACGSGKGDGPTSGDPGTTTTAASARPDFRAADVQVRALDIDFRPRAYRARAGEVTIGYVNEGEIFHTLALDAPGGGGVEGWDRLEVPEHGDVAVGTVALDPGEYVLFCDVAGHRGAGMEAVLTVEA